MKYAVIYKKLGWADGVVIPCGSGTKQDCEQVMEMFRAQARFMERTATGTLEDDEPRMYRISEVSDEVYQS